MSVSEQVRNTVSEQVKHWVLTNNDSYLINGVLTPIVDNKKMREINEMFVERKEKYDDEYGLNDIKVNESIKVLSLLTCRAGDERFDTHTRQHYYNNAKNLLYTQFRNDMKTMNYFETMLQKIGDVISSEYVTFPVHYEKGFTIGLIH